MAHCPQSPPGLLRSATNRCTRNAERNLEGSPWTARSGRSTDRRAGQRWRGRQGEQADAPVRQAGRSHGDAARCRGTRAHGSGQGGRRKGPGTTSAGSPDAGRRLLGYRLHQRVETAPADRLPPPTENLVLPGRHHRPARDVLFIRLLCRPPRLAAPSLKCPEPALQGWRCIALLAGHRCLADPLRKACPVRAEGV